MKKEYLKNLLWRYKSKENVKRFFEDNLNAEIIWWHTGKDVFEERYVGSDFFKECLEELENIPN